MKTGDTIKIGDMDCKVDSLDILSDDCRIKMGAYRYTLPRVILEEIERLKGKELKRYPVQISSTDGGNRVVHVLCNDGTMWYRHYDRPWAKVKDVPQPGELE